MQSAGVYTVDIYPERAFEFVIHRWVSCVYFFELIFKGTHSVPYNKPTFPLCRTSSQFN